VIVYKDLDFHGPNARLQPGTYRGRELQGTRANSSISEDLDNNISSIRVDPGYIAVLFGSYAPSISGKARVVIGPEDISDLGTIGLSDQISSISVYTHQPHVSSHPRDFGAKIYSQTYKGGRSVSLGQGLYNRTRLNSDEVNFRSIGVQSICVGANTLAILYEGGLFENNKNSILIPENTCIDDLTSMGVSDGVNSIQILYTEKPPVILSTSQIFVKPSRVGERVGKDNHKQKTQKRHGSYRVLFLLFIVIIVSAIWLAPETRASLVEHEGGKV